MFIEYPLYARDSDADWLGMQKRVVLLRPVLSTVYGRK